MFKVPAGWETRSLPPHKHTEGSEKGEGKKLNISTHLHLGHLGIFENHVI